MAHEIEIINGEPQFCFVGSTPWHGLGVQVNNDLSAKEMLVAAKLDWNVTKSPLFININGEMTEVESDQALLRSSDNRVLSVVSKDWNPVQNEQAFDFFKEFVDNGNMEMHTAGSLRNGNMVWALAKIKESFSLFNGKDTVESYMLFSNPHEYGKSIDIRFTPIRVVCNNTLTLSLQSKSDLAVRMNHRSMFDAERVKQTLGLAHSRMEQYKEVATFLSTKKFNNDSVLRYMTDVFPSTGSTDDSDNDNVKISRSARRSYEALETQPGHEYGAGTWWTAFNAVTYNIDHVLGRNASTRLNSSWYGVNRQKKINALELAKDYANAA